MVHSYADTWTALPADLQDRFGAAEPLTDGEWAQAVRAGVPVDSGGGKGPTRRRLAFAFRDWLADELDRQADAIDRMPERAERGTFPVRERDLAKDPAPLTPGEITRAAPLRDRAARLRAEDYS